jgi:hypothetical protein
VNWRVQVSLIWTEEGAVRLAREPGPSEVGEVAYSRDGEEVVEEVEVIWLAGAILESTVAR